MSGPTLTGAAAGFLGAASLLLTVLRTSRSWRCRLLGDPVKLAPPLLANGANEHSIPAKGVRLAAVMHSSSPNPDYEPGDKQPHPFNSDKMLALDPAEHGAGLYPFVISSVVPRPVAFISTVGADGVGNLSPYSYFNVMSHDPPYVTIGHCHSSAKPGGKKDSLTDIMETGEFVVCIISEWFVEAANFTCGNYDKSVNEMELAELTPVPSVKVKPPRVKESAVHFECKLRHTYDVKNSKGEVTCTIVIGEVVLAHMLEGVATTTPTGKPMVNIDKYHPVSRLGGNSYGRITEVYDIPRPDKEWQFKRGAVAKPSEPAG